MIKKQLTEYFVRLFPGEYCFWRLFVYIYVKFMLNFKFLFSVRNWVQLFIYIWTCDKVVYGEKSESIWEKLEFWSFILK